LTRPAVALLGLCCAAAALAAWEGRRPAVDATWDEGRLTAELKGLGYHVHAEPLDREGAPLPNGVRRPVLAGLYVSREGPADWDDVAAQRWAGRWRGCAVALPHGGRPVEGDPRYLAAGPWLFFGDPAELDRVAGRLGLAR
jgi:hypothetical protein